MSGIISIGGGLNILPGFIAKSWLLVLFLVAVTFMMQQFQMAMFLRNISMLGAAVFCTQVGTGSLSLDSRRVPAR